MIRIQSINQYYVSWEVAKEATRYTVYISQTPRGCVIIY